jgi:D-alanyl-D-alanine dipeptidase
MPAKPYHHIPIQECGAALIPIPLDTFAVFSPHIYEQLGAPYDGYSPYSLREGVVSALISAQNYLQQARPGWGFQIFDGFRPVAVQQFMVDYTFAEVLKSRQLESESLGAETKAEVWEKVYTIWAIPDLNPATPPPHSTGAAVDLTLIDEQGELVDMGGEIDEMSARSRPNYYAETNPYYHTHRQLLNDCMIQAGFRRHPGEWWHFSLGDQMWAWQQQRDNPNQSYTAYYGRIAL